MNIIEEFKDELRNITDPSGMTFIDKFGQYEVMAIESFISFTIEKALDDQKKELEDVWANYTATALDAQLNQVREIVEKHRVPGPHPDYAYNVAVDNILEALDELTKDNK